MRSRRAESRWVQHGGDPGLVLGRGQSVEESLVGVEAPQFQARAAGEPAGQPFGGRVIARALPAKPRVDCQHHPQPPANEAGQPFERLEMEFTGHRHAQVV